MSVNTGKYIENLPLAYKGDLDAMYNLAMCYLVGDGVNRDLQSSLTWLEKAAANEHEQAICALTYLYGNGDGVAFGIYDDFDDELSKIKSDADHVKYAEMGVDLGIPYCYYCMGYVYVKGIGGKPKNMSVAVTYWKDVAELDADNARKYKNYKSHFSAYRAIAYSCYNIGIAYLRGGDGISINYQSAIDWWERSARLGCDNAYLQLIDFFESGEYVPRDRTRALYWLRLKRDSITF